MTLEDFDKAAFDLFKKFEPKVVFTTGKPENKLSDEFPSPCYVSKTGITFEKLSYTITLTAENTILLNDLVVKFKKFCKQNSIGLLASRDNVKKHPTGMKKVCYCEFIYESEWE